MSELLAAAEERWRQTVDSAPIGIALIGLDGRFQDANEALAELFGYPRELLLRRRVRTISHPDDALQFRELSDQLLAGTIPRYRVRKRWVRRDGEVVWAEVYVSLARGPDGTPLHFVAYVEDVSEHVAIAARLDRINRDLTEQSARLERSNDDLEAFATVASHDLQAPLSTIRGYLDLLDSEYGDRVGPQGALWLSRAGDAAARMSDLLTSLLEFSRAAGAGQPHLRPLVLGHVLRQVLADLEGVAGASHLIVHEAGTDAVVHADPPRLHQVLQNLLHNAVKYRHPERRPTVTVAVHDLGGSWQVDVADNGLGVPDGEGDAIFGMFRQSGRNGAGFGVGLAVCRRIIERHGGRLWVEPVLSGGSTFSFTLPHPRHD